MNAIIIVHTSLSINIWQHLCWLGNHDFFWQIECAVLEICIYVIVLYV